MTDIAVKTTNLSKRFGKNMAVKKVSLQIKHGEIYGFLGPNGAGKSTTVKLLVGLLKPTGGSAQILGLDLQGATNDIRLLIGAALQEAALDENQTGREVLELQGRLYGLTRSEIATRMQSLSQLVDIGEALDQRIKTYSGGMKRRVDLATALIHNPKILFLDEPTTGLDPISRNKVWQEVRALNKDLGMTIFLTTQYLEEADQLADRVGIINQGSIVEEDTPQNLKRRIGNDVVTITLDDHVAELAKKIQKIAGVKGADIDDNTIAVRATDASKILPKLVKMIDDQDARLLDINVRQSSLDEVFLEVTGNAEKRGAND